MDYTESRITLLRCRTLRRIAALGMPECQAQKTEGKSVESSSVGSTVGAITIGGMASAIATTLLTVAI